MNINALWAMHRHGVHYVAHHGVHEGTVSIYVGTELVHVADSNVDALAWVRNKQKEAELASN